MSQKSPTFQFYVRDWLLSRKVRDMTGSQVKAYIYLLCESWLETPRATLPNDLVKLASMAQQSSKQWAEDCHAVMACWILGKDNRWHNERLIQVSKIQQKNFLNGKKGGRPIKK